MSDFTDEYKNLLIRQYWDKPNAVSQVEMTAASWETIFDVAKSFLTEFDVDYAYGDRLRIISNIVGLENTQLFATDSEHRFYLNAKILKNSTVPKMISETGNSIQDTIAKIFEGEAYALNLMRMNLGLVIDSTYDMAVLQMLVDLDLLPRSRGIQWNSFTSYTPSETFGFESNPDAKGFASSTDPAYDGGVFARKVVIT